MYKEYQRYYYENIYKIYSEELKKIAKEFKLNYEELEKTYLSIFKEYIKKD